MGPNGSGKTTLASVLMGHPGLEITEGAIYFEGEDITGDLPDKRATRGIFMAFQHPTEIPGVPVVQFLRQALSNRTGIDYSIIELRLKVMDAMADLGIPGHFADRYLNEGFSGGERKRNEILQMAILEPKLAILDETDSGLDIDALRTVSDGVQRMVGPERGFLIITHFQRLLDYITPHYVHVLVGGKLVKTGGAEAKDPLGTGLIINIVTKSGGNDLSASASYDHQEYDWGTGDDEGLGGFFGDNELPDNFNPFASELASFQALGVYNPPDTVVAGAGTPTAHLVRQADFSAGGPILRDRAWFFGTYRYADLAARISRSAVDVDRLSQLSGIPLASGLGSAPTYSAFPNTTKSHQPYVKLTARLNPSHELSAYYQRDQLDNTSNREYDIAPRFTVKTGGDLFGAKLTSVFGANTTGQFLASWNNKASEVLQDAQPQLASIPLYVEIHDGFTVNPSGTTGDGGRIAALGTGGGGANGNQGQIRPTRLLLLRGDLTHYVDDLAGSHEIGFGVYAAPWNLYEETRLYSPGGAWRQEWHAPVDANGNQVSDLSQAVRTVWYRRRWNGTETAPASELLVRDARDSDLAVYLQDAWRPNDRLTLNLGLRADWVKRHDGILDIDRMDAIARPLLRRQRREKGDGRPSRRFQLLAGARESLLLICPFKSHPFVIVGGQSRAIFAEHHLGAAAEDLVKITQVTDDFDNRPAIRSVAQCMRLFFADAARNMIQYLAGQAHCADMALPDLPQACRAHTHLHLPSFHLWEIPFILTFAP